MSKSANFSFKEQSAAHAGERMRDSTHATPSTVDHSCELVGLYLSISLGANAPDFCTLFSLAAAQARRQHCSRSTDNSY